MQQLIEFITNHILLFSALVIVLVLIAQNLIAGFGGKQSIAPLQATQMINREDAVVIDVRPLSDFNNGHIVNAINIPTSALKNQISQVAKHKEKPIIVACRSGAQSSAACKLLRDAGIERVYNLQGGMLAWQSDSLPISKK
ncbi:MAG: rhodanese-like domain-containing protein [Sedimenticola sp.]|uniref:Rhodanese-like domain-containing protein n=1 Tax=Sedimenticola thiotaurini TaxID=1543721 RepID=A0A558DG49_9GAMM|nr:rhodanese-like domain-containing protein [Sedimenticola sp.]TVT60005.1 MAG: rhodanese-like domain-containing protein [Sedimenticola thiotaurini]MCW8882617.1 rhodanese-like domain-containing protein [Sedimenticola sp.]MCW8947592.1 rhodanese-like domain-containing protein [Sedimenticola sp.]MCW9021515.1 rhodanese-like domain-containing protein [Sedimenticola sp.]